MPLPEPQHLPDLPIRHRGAELGQFPGDRRAGAVAGQEFPCRGSRGDGVIDRVEHLETEPVLLDAQVYDLAEVARIDVTPGVALARGRIGQESGKHVVFVRLDDIADAQCIDVDAVAQREGAGRLLVDDLGQPVAVHRINVLGLLEREALEVPVAFRKTNAVGGFAGGDDDLAHAKLRRRLDHIVGADGVLTEGFVVGMDQNARNRGEMHHRVRRRRGLAVLEAIETEMRGQDIEGLTVIGQIGHQRVDGGMIERLEVDIEQPVSLPGQIRQDMTSRLACSTSENHTLACHQTFSITHCRGN